VHDISRETKVAVYQAIVLYGCETLTLYQRSVCRLDQFHPHCLHKISRIKWQDRVWVTNTDGTTGIEAFLLKAQLRWVGHVMHAHDVTNRIPALECDCLACAKTVAFQSRYSVDNSQLVAVHGVGLSGDT